MIRTCARMCVMQSREIVHAPAVAGTRPAGRLRSEPEICACDFKFALRQSADEQGCGRRHARHNFAVELVGSRGGRESQPRPRARPHGTHTWTTP